MTAMDNIHKEHKKLLSEVQFMRQEIRFFCILIDKEYKAGTSMSQRSILDAYADQFNVYAKELDDLIRRIHFFEEKLSKSIDLNRSIDDEFSVEELTLISDTKRIYASLKSMKESLYDFIIEDHRIKVLNTA